MSVLMSDVEEKEEGPANDGVSVIVTPGPRPEPNSVDREFIKRDSEGVSPPPGPSETTMKTLYPPQMRTVWMVTTSKIMRKMMKKTTVKMMKRSNGSDRHRHTPT